MTKPPDDGEAAKAAPKVIRLPSALSGFDWDWGNREKCTRHGLSHADIEALFRQNVDLRRDLKHSGPEDRFIAHGRVQSGRWVLVAFTLRVRGGAAYIRPISARYMHSKEVRRYEQDNPDFPH